MNDLTFYRRLVIVNALVPGVLLAWDAYHGQLGANAANQALHITGTLSLVFLFLTLAVTPLKYLTGSADWIAIRRTLGLSGFGYAALHLLVYVVYDRNLSLSSTLSEILTRRFLQIGMVALLLMVPLAMTSTNAMVRRLGAKRWKLLHRLTYVVAILGVVHYYMLVKSDVRQPLAFAAVLTPLLVLRLTDFFRSRPANSKIALSETNQAPPKIWKGQLRVEQIIDETHNVKTFRLVSPDSELPFTHVAGQFLSLTLRVQNEVIRRSYTIASSPAQRGRCEITVKQDGRASQYLHSQLQPGDLLDIAAPAGKFVFRGTESSRLVLIAGGVGITPLMSITRWLSDSGWTGSIDFLIVAATVNDLIFDDELQTLSRGPLTLRLHQILTREQNSPRASLHGRMTANFLRATIPDLASVPIYLCGPNAMMDATIELLTDCGAPQSSIHTEVFSPLRRSSTPDGTPASTNAVSQPEVQSALVTFLPAAVMAQAVPGATILETAEDAGITIPYECRAGICGQCLVRCEAGTVTMASSDALTAAERQQGFILACQSVPSTSEVRIVL